MNKWRIGLWLLMIMPMSEGWAFSGQIRLSGVIVAPPCPMETNEQKKEKKENTHCVPIHTVTQKQLFKTEKTEGRIVTVTYL
ncbi:hypothetical protein ACPV5G_16065 [Photobacterium damselae]|uniref:hypothetical protein n=1 Tax=Photobacterium damselae TaxID=38293 RepID=UPI0040687420